MQHCTLLKGVMPRSKNHPVYTAIAPFYNGIMEHVDYRGWGEYLSRVLKPFVKKSGVLLELASGTGKLIKYLKVKHTLYIQSDLSFPMLAESPHKNNRLNFDMREIPLKENSIDVSICTFDALNYILNKRMMKKTFSGIYRMTAPGGLFVFDVALEANSYEYQKSGTRAIFGEDGLCEQYTEYNDRTKIHTNKFRVIDLDGNTRWETHRQRIYPVSFFAELSVQTGFEIVSAFDAFTERPLRAKSLRAQFIVRKPYA